MSGVNYPIDTCEEPLYTLLYNCGLTEISAEDYNVLAAADPATMQSYLEAAAADPESYPWESVIYTLSSAGEGAAEEGAAVAEEGAVAEGEGAVEGYAEGEYAEGQEGYAEGQVGYAEGQEGEAEGEYQYAVGEEGAAEGGAEGEEYQYAEGEEDGYYEDYEDGYYEEEEEVRELAPLPVIEEEKPPEGSWVCAKCTYLNKNPLAAVCAMCFNPKDVENVPPPGKVAPIEGGKGKLQWVVSSRDIPNSKNLRGAFKVQKVNNESFMGGKKDRVFEVDFFTRCFKNCETNGKVGNSYQSANLYRVERVIDNPKALRLLFFKQNHPVELIFPNCSTRQRFIELATLQRRNPVIWAPSFCKQNCKELLVKVEGKTIEHNGKDIPVSGNQSFMVSRMPYEVQHLWVGTINCMHRGLPTNNPNLPTFLPNTSDLYFIGLQDVPSNMLKSDSKVITDFFSNYFGANFYVLLNTASESNIFAGIEGRKPIGSPCVLVIVVRRSGLAKVGNVDYVELIEDGKKPDKADSTGVFACLRLQESTIGVMVQNISPNLPDTLARNEKITNFLQKIKCGDPMIDISNRFDYFFLVGSLGYSTLPTDELHAQIGGQVVLSDFQECTILQDMCLPDRVLFWHRPRSAKATILAYSNCPGLAGFNNLQGQFDLFVQRPYCYALSPATPEYTVNLQSILFNCDTLTEVRDAECRIVSDAFEDVPITLPLKNASGRYTNMSVPPLVPVCPAYEYLRAQSITFSFIGIAPGVTKKKDVIASAVIPLRDVLLPDEIKPHQAFALRHSTVIGFLETYVTMKKK